MENERPSFEEREKLCKFIVHLLTYCGELVKSGHLKPFNLLKDDPTKVRERLQNDAPKRDMVASYDRLLKDLKINKLGGKRRGKRN